jgi:hypothetical protein
VTDNDPLTNLRRICLALPEATEKPGGRPMFQVREKTFAMFMDDHHGDGRVALWCKGSPGLQDVLIGSGQPRFFIPPYVGHSGWIGVRLDLGETVDWEEVEEFVIESYRMTAPKRLIAQLEPVEDDVA